MTILALHGFTQTPTQWTGIFDDYAGFWLPGHGPEPDLGARSFDEAVDAFLEKARSLGRPRVLVGYSMGARLALGALAREPSLFEQAVLLGVQPGLSLDDERDARQSWESGLIRLLEEQGLEAFLDEWERLPLFLDQKSGEASLTQTKERRKNTAEGLAHALTVLGLGAMPSYWDALRTIRCPVELLVGSRDAKFLAIADQMLLLLRAGRLHRIDDSGHNPLIDAPDQARRLLREVVTTRRPSSMD